MCPEKSTISAFYDDALDEPSRMLVSDHLQVCEKCRGELESLTALTARLEPVQEGLVDQVSVRSKPHVLARAAIGPNVWQRTLRVPAPLVAAAATLIVVLFIGLVLSLQRSAGTAIRVGSSTIASSRTAFEEIVRYLDSRSLDRPVVIELPADARLRVMSEPVFLRADEYQRSIE